MSPNFITTSPVLKKFTDHGYEDHVRDLTRGMGLTIIAAEFKDNISNKAAPNKTPDQPTKPSSLFGLLTPRAAKPQRSAMPAAFGKDYEPKSATPTNEIHHQRLAMLILLKRHPQLSLKLDITRADMDDLKLCFDPNNGGSERYRITFDRMTSPAGLESHGQK